jgi:hypothetical protein
LLAAFGLWVAAMCWSMIRAIAPGSEREATSLS